MAQCLHPMDCYPAAPPEKNRRSIVPDANGVISEHKPSRRPVFKASKSYHGAKSFKVPCGQCMNCRVGKATAWATRINHEAFMWEHNVFVTLTYADEHLPLHGGLEPEHMRVFLNSLRKRLERDGRPPIRFFYCGEYGENSTKRPHYHIIIFNLELTDLEPWRNNPSGFVTYRSAYLEQLWTKGFVEVGTVTSESANYVASYSVKKLGGKAAEEANYRSHPSTGEFFTTINPFVRMSRMPGIGFAFFEKFREDFFPSDFIIINGKKRPIPPYYLRQLDELGQLRVKSSRKRTAFKNANRLAYEASPERIAARETIANDRVRRRTRDVIGEEG